MILTTHCKSFLVLYCTARKPHFAAVGQETLNGGLMDVNQQVLRKVSLLQVPEEVMSLLSLPHLMRDVSGPGEVGVKID